jgi:hypothetical protein
VAGVAQVALAVEQVERAVHPEPQATQAAREAVRVAPALRNPPAAPAKAVRVAIALLNPPVARARIASIPQGRELGRGALPTLKAERAAPPDSDKRSPRATPPIPRLAPAQVIARSPSRSSNAGLSRHRGRTTDRGSRRKRNETPKIRCGAYIRCMLIERMRKRLGDSLREAILAHSQGDDQALQ